MTTQNEAPVPHAEPKQIPDSIAKLMGARAFDITKHRFEDFQAEAQQATAAALTFMFGKPAGTAKGVAILTQTASQLQVNLYIRRSGKVVRYARPTAEFAEPELAGFLEPVHLVPAVDVTNSEPIGYLWPFRVSAWDGYKSIFTALGRLDAPREGLYLRYVRGAGSDPGHYEADPFPMEKGHTKLWETVPWPRPEDLPFLIPSVPFEELVGEDFNLRRAVQARRTRGLP